MKGELYLNQSRGSLLGFVFLFGCSSLPRASLEPLPIPFPLGQRSSIIVSIIIIAALKGVLRGCQCGHRVARSGGGRAEGASLCSPWPCEYRWALGERAGWGLTSLGSNPSPTIQCCAALSRLLSLSVPGFCTVRDHCGA
jgi:hypothetical protein